MKFDLDDAYGPAYPLPWTAEIVNGEKGYIRLLDANSNRIGIDAFPTRPACDPHRVRGSLAVLLHVMNDFHERNSKP